MPIKTNSNITVVWLNNILGLIILCQKIPSFRPPSRAVAFRILNVESI